MRIAVPLHQGKLSEHFGGAESFAFYTVDEANGTVN
jgi:predicted Fe-Mo cluster-binding NifX family protein